MIRLLILWVLGYVLYRLIFNPPGIGFFGSFFGSAGKRLKKKPRHPDAEEMVPCAHCGTFIAKREADERGGRFYCKPRCR